MTQRIEEWDIEQGPSKFDLMLALFDTDHGARILEFDTYSRGSLLVEVNAITRFDLSATHWYIEGKPMRSGRRVSIDYRTDSRKGRTKFESIEASSIASTESKKVLALMTVIVKMVAEYQKYNVGHLSEKFFRLFEKAKRVDLAKDAKTLSEAIEDIAQD